MHTPYYIAVCIYVFCLLCSVQAADRIQCSAASNYGPGTSTLQVYNTACSDRQYPYCSGSECGECSSGKPDSACDCPANYDCVQAVFNPVRNAAFCAPYPASLHGRSCTQNSDCVVQLLNQQTNTMQDAIAGVCVSGECGFCNPAAEQTITCQWGPVPDGSNPKNYGSKGGEVRACLANAWNSAVWPLPSPLPSDPYSRERSLYPSQSAASPSVAPSSASPTASLSVGASPSSAGSNVVSSAANCLIVSSVLCLIAVLCCAL